MTTRRLTLRQPDDWHIHLRDDAMLRAVLPATAGIYARAIVMPNLKPPVTTTALASAYRDRIHAACARKVTRILAIVATTQATGTVSFHYAQSSAVTTHNPRSLRDARINAFAPTDVDMML